MQSPTLRNRRIINELKQIQSQPAISWRIVVRPNMQTVFWNCWIQTDSSTPFYGREFKLVIEFGEEYPKDPPKFVLENPEMFFHPNINPESGYICSQTIKKILVSEKVRDRIEAFMLLLSNPNPGNPLNYEASALYEKNPKKYYTRALKIFRGKEKQNLMQYTAEGIQMKMFEEDLQLLEEQQSMIALNFEGLQIGNKTQIKESMMKKLEIQRKQVESKKKQLQEQIQKDQRLRQYALLEKEK